MYLPDLVYTLRSYCSCATLQEYGPVFNTFWM